MLIAIRLILRSTYQPLALQDAESTCRQLCFRILQDPACAPLLPLDAAVLGQDEGLARAAAPLHELRAASDWLLRHFAAEPLDLGRCGVALCNVYCFVLFARAAVSRF